MSDRSVAPPMQRRGGNRPQAGASSSQDQQLRRPPPRPRPPPPPCYITGPTDPDARTGNTGPPPPSYAKGGTVKKTGKIKAHKGEVVLPIAVVKKLKKLLK